MDTEAAEVTGYGYFLLGLVLLGGSLHRRRWIMGSLGETGFLCAGWYEEISLPMFGWDGPDGTGVGRGWDGGTDVSRRRNESATIGS